MAPAPRCRLQTLARPGPETLAPEGEEREIAAPFIDLVGSTSLPWERPPS